ncbi:hypothetical protein BDB00DRAFT_788249 [Zychaea mexicana]|uniref:uncharacterized protein n=1 Tax=Zychaea mexicana TaxID=64656 RepID=UPI0022FEE889|nr:uncharacterized protein BDB00DRAFT_788249 [Zychaea mexicana]KAI9493017.1 hypothetical protein BDB00DRAFT_788249 [Zychaea mexicana]
MTNRRKLEILESQKNKEGHKAGRPKTKDSDTQLTLQFQPTLRNTSAAAAPPPPLFTPAPTSADSSTDQVNYFARIEEPGVPLSDLLVDIEPRPTTTNNDDDLDEDDDLDDTLKHQESDLTNEDGEEPVRVQGHAQVYLLDIQKQVVDDVRQYGEPRQYKNKSFWIYPSDAFFVLREKLDPKMLYLPRIFIWIPHILVKHFQVTLKCVSCNGELKSKGYNNIGRRVLDLDSSFYIIGTRYQCKKCLSELNSHDPSVWRYRRQWEI